MPHLNVPFAVLALCFQVYVLLHQQIVQQWHQVQHVQLLILVSLFQVEQPLHVLLPLHLAQEDAHPVQFWFIMEVVSLVHKFLVVLITMQLVSAHNVVHL